MPNIERIYPEALDPRRPNDEAILAVHLERYRYAAAHASGARILDMACGCGYGSALLAEANPDKAVVGVDIDPDAIAYARVHYRLPNLAFVCADAARFSDADKFDTIVSLETIEHLPAPPALVERYVALLASAGQIIASVPITPTKDGNPYHLHDFTRRSFFSLFRRQGLAPHDAFEQIQWWQFKGLFAAGNTTQDRSEGVGRTVAQYYLQHPAYLFSRLYSMGRHGFSNRYLTCVFKPVDTQPTCP